MCVNISKDDKQGSFGFGMDLIHNCLSRNLHCKCASMSNIKIT
jgi:hypothetical protein